jgi:hypothetical protein
MKLNLPKATANGHLPKEQRDAELHAHLARAPDADLDRLIAATGD